jgi:hypothetical protein
MAEEDIGARDGYDYARGAGYGFDYIWGSLEIRGEDLDGRRDRRLDRDSIFHGYTSSEWDEGMGEGPRRKFESTSHRLQFL